MVIFISGFSAGVEGVDVVETGNEELEVAFAVLFCFAVAEVDGSLHAKKSMAIKKYITRINSGLSN